MKKQLFLSVALLVLSMEVFARIGGAGTAGGSATPGRRPVPSKGGGQTPGGQTPGGQGTSAAAAQAAQGLTPAQAIASAMEALNVTAEEVAAATSVQKAVNYIQG